MVILDASALYPLAKHAQRNPLGVAERLLREEAAVLDLTLYEAANAAIVEARRGLVEDPVGLASSLAALAEHLRVVRVNPRDLGPIASLAEELGLTAYDAAYVYYARLHGATLVTSDREILEKAPDVAVETLAWLEGRKETA